MGTFAERAGDAMQAALIGSLAGLSLRTAAHRFITEARLREIWRDPEGMSARELVTLGKVLKVRFSWLLDGELPVTPRGSPNEAEILLVAGAISPEQMRKWLRIGRRMTWEN